MIFQTLIDACSLREEEWPKVPPKSKVHATDSEWYALVKEGVGRKVFGEIPYGEIFKTLVTLSSMEPWG